MAEVKFPVPVAEVVATLAEFFRLEHRSKAVVILSSARARFDTIKYDDINGSGYTWALRLEVPVPVFTALESDLSTIEEDLLKKLAYLNRLHPREPLTQVTITPTASDEPVPDQRIVPSDVEVRRLWPEGRFRLFLSHVSKYKVLVYNLKKELADYGISAFVAHEDIEPTTKWHDEIELRLRSMHALVALITPDFHASFWTDQEIGWALGRGVLVVPVRLGADPYGLAGKYQAVSGSLDRTERLAELIIQALLANPQTRDEIRHSIVYSFCRSTSFIMSSSLRHQILKIDGFTKKELNLIFKACKDNEQIYKVNGLTASIYKKFGTPVESEVEPINESSPLF